jgi:acyl carrier protein
LDTSARILTMIRDELLSEGPAAQLMENTPLLEGLLDSAALMQLVTCIEEEFGVDVEDSEIATAYFATPADIARMVERKLADEHRASPEADDGSPGSKR